MSEGRNQAGAIEADRHWSVIRSVTYLTAGAFFVMALVEAAVTVGTVTLAMAGLALTAVTAYSFGLSRQVRANIALTVGAGLLFTHVWFNGGPNAAALRAMPLLPIAATWMSGRRVGAVFAVLVALGVEIVFFLSQQSFEFPVTTAPEVEQALIPHLSALVALLAYGFAALYELARERSEAERDVLTRQARLAQRLASIGTLTSGIAHEINNPLTAIGVSLEYLREEAAERTDEEAEEVRAAISDSETALVRIATVVGNMQNMTARYDSAGVSNLNQVAEAAVAMLQSSLRRGDSIEVALQDAPKVNVAPELLHQVLWNLFSNAIQVHHAKDNSDDCRVRVFVEQRGADILTIAVEDNGPGIPEEHLESIFNPFFTTKAVWTAPGLGLAVTAQILNDCGGTIEAQNLSPQGARFESGCR